MSRFQTLIAAFVLHDMFAVPFEEIAPMVGRTSAAARQLASRARRRVRGATPAGSPIVPGSARSSTPGSGPHAAVTSRGWLRCCTRTPPTAVLAFTVTDGLIVEIDILADPQRLAALDFAR